MLSRVKSKGLLSFLFVVALIASFLTSTAYASGNGMNFVVEPLMPDNQTDSDLGYFDIAVTPDSKQTLTLTVKNSTAKPMVVEVEVISASTTSSGEINYTTAGIQDDTLTTPFSEIATVKDKQLTIPANSNGSALVEITLPKEEFDGIILGGVRIKDITARLEKEKADASPESSQPATESSVEIVNEYEFVTSVVLRETNNTVDPHFELLQIHSETINRRASIVVQIRNPQSNIVKYAKFYGSILPKGTSDQLFSVDGKEIDMAPHSVMNYLFVDEAGYGVQAGDYTFVGKIEYDDQTWDFNKDFNIAAAEAAAVNNAALNQQQSQVLGIPLWAIIAIIIGVLVVLLLLILISKMNKSKKANS